MKPLRTAVAAILALGLAPAAAQPSARAPIQTIGLYSYGYQPSLIVLAAGKPVTLRFVNRSGNGHDFSADRFFRAASILSGPVDGGEVGLGPGQTKWVTLVPAAGTYPVHCSHFLHDQLGMHTMVVVR